MKKRLLAAIMSLCMIVSLLPVSAFAAPDSYDKTFNLEVGEEDRISGGGSIFGRSHNWAVNNEDVVSVYPNDSTARIVARSEGDTDITHTYTTPLGRETEYYHVTVTPKAVKSWGEMEFGVYYRYDNRIPDNPQEDSSAIEYGPSGNDKPLYTITIDIDKLLTIYPAARTTWENAKHISYTTCGAEVGAWWENVLSCMDETDQAKFDTNIGRIFQGYILKRDIQSDTPNHMDGILTEEPPLYTVELYENNAPAAERLIEVLYTNQEGGISVQDGGNSVRAALESYLETEYGTDQVNWTSVSAGSFTADDGKYYQIALTFTPALGVDNELNYEQIGTSSYYYAKVVMELTEVDVGWSVTKTVDRVLRGGEEVTVNDGFEAQVGDQIFWKIEVKNEGEAPLSGITLNDKLNEETTLSVYSNENCSSESIVTGSIDITVGETKTYYATYTVQADDSGNLSNTVTASLGGRDEKGTNDDISVQARYTLTVASYLESTSGTKLDGEQYGGTYPMAAGTEWSVEIFENVASGTATHSAPKTITVDDNTYSFDPNLSTNPLSGTMTAEGNTVQLVYSLDEVGGPDGGSDGIPDKYQKEVTYVISGGTWDDHTIANKVEYVTLRDENNNYSTTGSGTLQNVPKDMIPADSSAEPQGWTPEIPVGNLVRGNEPDTYTYRFGVQAVGVKVPYNVEYYFEQPGGTYSQDTTKTERNYAAVGTEVTAEGEAFDGYCLNSEKSVTTDTIKKIESLDDIVTLKLYYDIDKVGGEDGGGDGIPDRYQKKVTFKVVNGTWDGTDSSDKIVYVTLETDGEWDVNGSGTLTAPTGMQPNVGYTEGAWEDETPPATVTGTEDATYTYTFTAMTYYTVTYNPNEGTLASGAESVTVAKGWSVNLESVAARDDYIFMGWTTDEIPGKIYHAGDPLPDKIYQVGETFTPEKDITVYAVWGADTNGDKVADVNQVFVEPAPITIYTGGDGYTSAVEGSGDSELGKTSSGLPTPGFYITLPYELDQKLKENAGVSATTTLDLSKYLSFHYDENNDGVEERVWNLARYDANGESQAYNRFIYRILPAQVGDEEIPIRLVFKDANNNETLSDDFTISMDALSQTYSMTIYAGALRQDQITAELTGLTHNASVGVATSTLTVRGVTADGDPTTEILTNAPTRQLNDIQAHANGVDYYINDSALKVSNPDAVKLLVDDLVADDAAHAALRNAADAAILAKTGTDLSGMTYNFQYLDLVDSSNGNAYVTLGDGQSVNIYWPVPDDAAAGTDFYVVHYDGLDRNFTDLAGALENAALTVYEPNVVNGNLVFQTGTFSPFVLIYEEKAQPVNPDHGGSGGGHDNDDSDPTGNLSIELDVNGGDDEFTFTVILTDKDGDDLENNFYYNGDYTGTIGSGDEITLEGGDKIVIRNLPEGTRYEVIIETADGYTYVIDGEEGVIHTGMNEAEFTATRTVPVADPSVTGVSRWLNTTDHIAYLTGYPGGAFGPNNNMTRAEVAQMFYALLNNKNVTITKTFPDVPADAWYATAVNTLASLGMVSGDENGNYRPNDPITRAEFCVIALAFAYEPENAVCYFGDVSRSDWFYTYVAQAASYGWIGGYTNGNFGPNDRITRAQVTTIVNNMLGRAADRDYVIDHQADLVQFTDLTRAHWGYFQIMEATNAHDYTKSNGTENWR